MNLLCVSPTQEESPLVSCGSEPTSALLVAADMRAAAEVAQYAGCGRESATAVGANRRGLDQLLILEKDLIREKKPPCMKTASFMRPRPQTSPHRDKEKGKKSERREIVLSTHIFLHDRAEQSWTNWTERPASVVISLERGEEGSRLFGFSTDRFSHRLRSVQHCASSC